MTEEAVRSIIQELANQLQTPVTHLWEVMIRQAYVMGAVHIVLYVVGFLLLIYLVRKMKEWWVAYREAEWRDEGPYMTAVAISVFYITTYVFSVLVTFGNAATMIFNPEYWVLQQIMNLLGG